MRAYLLYWINTVLLYTIQSVIPNLMYIVLYEKH